MLIPVMSYFFMNIYKPSQVGGFSIHYLWSLPHIQHLICPLHRFHDVSPPGYLVANVIMHFILGLPKQPRPPWLLRDHTILKWPLLQQATPHLATFPTFNLLIDCFLNYIQLYYLKLRGAVNGSVPSGMIGEWAAGGCGMEVECLELDGVRNVGVEHIQDVTM